MRNVPLADVLRNIEKQTWTKIRAERGTEARITLHVIDLPLTNVRNRIGASPAWDSA